MSIIQKLLGGPGYFMEADEETLSKIESSASAKPTSVKQKPVDAAPVTSEPVVPEPVVPEPTVVAVDPEAPVVVAEQTSMASEAEVVPVAVADQASKKKSRRKKKKTGKASQDNAAVVAPETTVGDIQSLVDAAIAEASAQVQTEDSAPAQTFSTDFLLTSTMKGRRRPGPSLTGFMDMAGAMKRR
ncbi:MAG: hypothetical protein F6K09_33095 [Merismopedia sp. SIO2A8]|nr:hypothetical protein [Merismopedia sp. SIO2A8]